MRRSDPSDGLGPIAVNDPMPLAPTRIVRVKLKISPSAAKRLGRVYRWEKESEKSVYRLGPVDAD